MTVANTTYMELDPQVEARIRSDRANGWVNPWRFDDEAVVRREDNPHDEATLMRPAFKRDVEKIVNLPAYNHYADKTQVFSFTENSDITRRGLHVQLVGQIARNIGRMLGLNEDLIEAVSLGHDVGHTPFGHAGERFLNAVYHEHTGRYFNHNVHSVRVLDQLYRRNISLQTLDGVLCHNGEFEQQVLRMGDVRDFATFDDMVERCNQDEQNIAHLRPSTLEGCVVRVSDMIAYLGKDRLDAIDLGILDSCEMFDSRVIGTDNSSIIHNLTVDIVNNSYGKDRIAMSPEVFSDLKRAKRQNYDIIYLKEGMVGDTGNVVEEMFRDVYEVLLEDLRSGNESSPLVLHHVKRLVSKSRTISAEAYLSQEPNQIVVDYMASMTDSYFMALYGYLFPGRERNVAYRDYFSGM